MNVFLKPRSVEEKIIEGVLLIFVFGNLVYCLQDVILNQYSLLSLASLIMVIGGSISLYLLLFKEMYEVLVKPIILILLLIHTSIFFQLNGFYSTLSLDFINIGFVIVFVFRSRTRRIFLTLYLVIITTLGVVQFSVDVPDYYEDNIILDTLIHVLLSLYLGFVIKQEYDKAERTILSKNRELEEKNNEILAQNEEIASMNESLVETVSRRTVQLEQKDQKMTEYAFLNSHQVRGPLARILGIMEILRIEKPEEPILKDYLDKIRSNAEELDSVIKAINQTLNPE